RFAAGAVPEANRPGHYRAAKVQFVAVVEQLNLREADRVPAIDPELQHEPVGQIDEVLVADRDTTQDRRLPVIDPLGVRAGVGDPAGVPPPSRTPRAEPAVPGRGQNFAQTLLIWLVALVGERKLVYRESSNRRSLARKACQRPAGVSNAPPAAWRLVACRLTA